MIIKLLKSLRTTVFMLLLACAASLSAQTANKEAGAGGQQSVTGPVTGVVVDEYGDPLIGVSVQCTEHKTVGTATDNDGRFTLKTIPSGTKTLTLSYIGMKTMTVKLKKTMNITMKEDAKSIKEFIVNGYQQIDRRNLTSSTYSVDMEDIYVPGAASVDQMLEGKIPDLVVATNSGEINSTARLRVRGTSTIIGNREPLWVLDGIILTDPIELSADVLNDPDYVNRIGNAIAGINPQDIERIDVLKDAAATALYGTRAANGVIVVTSKSGREGRPIVSYNFQGTFRQRPRYTDRKIDLMNSADRVQFSQYLAESHYGYPSGMARVGYEWLLEQLYTRKISQEEFNAKVDELAMTNTDWFKILNHDSFSMDHSVNVSGGSEKIRYYTSFGYTDQDDVIKNTTNRRYTGMAKVNIKLAEKLQFEVNINGYVNDRKYNAGSINPTDYAYNVSRTIPAYNEDGSYYYYQKSSSSTSSGTVWYTYNILDELEHSYTKQTTQNVIATANLRWKPLEWLDFNWTVSGNASSSNVDTWYGEQTYYVAKLRGSNYGDNPPTSSELPYGGEFQVRNTGNKGYTTRLQMNINKYLGENNQHMINFALGVEASSTKTHGYSRTDRGYFADRGETFITGLSLSRYSDYRTWISNNVPTLTDGLSNMLSAYTTLTYAYKDFFTLNANGRYDGSNKFGSRSNEKLLPVWSVSGNANLVSIFNIDNNWLDNLTLKTSYGDQGNMLDGQMPVMILKKGSLDTYYNEFISTASSFANPDLRWEKTHSFNLGLESSFFGGRVQLGAEYYYKKTVDAFMSKTIADVNGYDSYTINSGTVTNKGFNITWSFTPVKLRHFYWILSGNASKVYNNVKTAPGAESYELSDFLNGTAVVEGQPIGTFYSYKFLGLNPNDGGPIFDDLEERQIDLESLSNYDLYTTVLTPSGKREHDLTGSFVNTFTYKHWRLGITCSYGFGASTRLFKVMDQYLTGYYSDKNVNADLMDRWTAPGDEYTTNIPAILGKNYDGYYNYSWHYSYSNGNIGSILPSGESSTYYMYDYGDQRVVSADYLKISQVNLTYEFDKKLLERLHLTRLAITLSGSNLYTFCDKKLRGQTPTQGGFSEVQLSERPYYTLGFNIQF